MGDLSDSDRTTLLEPCVCGHTINDHGSMGTCWMCSDEGLPDCKFHFEDLLTERIEAIVAARLARVEAIIEEHAWEYRSDPDYLVVDVNPIRAALTDQPASDHPAEAL